MRISPLLFASMSICSLVSAQCPVSDIVIPGQVCVESNFMLQNSSAAENFEWDFCPFDLSASPSVAKVFNTGLWSSIDVFFAEDGGRHYGFALDATTNSLMRMDFGANRETVPDKVNLGNVDGMLNFPNSFALIQENGSWLGIIANGGDNKVLLLNFGNNLSNTPVASVLYVRSDSGFANIATASTSPSSCALLIAEFNTRQVIVLDFGDGVFQPFTTRQFVSIPGSTPIDLQLIRHCDTWNAVVISFENRKMYKLDFGASFVVAPEILEYTVTLSSEPYRLALVREGEMFYGFVSTTSGGLSRVKLGNNLSSVSVIDGLGSFGVLSNSRSLYLEVKDGIWLAYMINYSDGDLYRLSFSGNCGVSKAYSPDRSPGYIHYTEEGLRQIAVTAEEADGTVLASTFAVEVSNVVASDFSIQQSNSCVESDILFEAVDVTGIVKEFYWRFGDGATSAEQRPAHRFQTDATYQVTLRVKDENSCINEKTFAAGIFEQPSPEFLQSFQVPACTNQNLQFTNTTILDPKANVGWIWYVNSTEVARDKDLVHQFVTTGPHIIKLVAAIPGCETEVQRNIGPLNEGPKVQFAYAGVCAGDVTSFTNYSEGEIDGYQWDFGDGTTSAAMHPDHTFSSYRTYEVRLTGSSPSGCSNVDVKAVSIGSKPLIDFRILDPPNSCTGVPSLFDNLSTSPDGEEISSWSWKFDDPNNQQTYALEDPMHTFVTPGLYDISLWGETVRGCASSVDKQVKILPSPTAAFTFSSACEDVPVLFTSPPVSDIQAWYWEIGTSYYYTSSPSHTFAAAGEYPLYAEFYGSNGCVSTRRETIRIPVPLTPDFSVIKNCVGEETLFTDITAGADPIATRLWTFSDGTSSAASSTTHKFSQQRTERVTLQLTSAAGCSYKGTKQIDIVPAPVAEFSATPTQGAYPMNVTFSNSSSSATSFLWEFNDGTFSTSSEESPQYTFSKSGDFTVRLTASNPQQCQSSFSQTISTVSPIPDVEVEMINLLSNPDGSGKLIVTVHNKGNTIVRDLPLILDFDGKLLLEESIAIPILPAGRFNFIFNTSILNQASLLYLCASADLKDDVVPEDNRFCQEFRDELYVFPVHPNPASKQLTFEWISASSKIVTVSIRDVVGRAVSTTEIKSTTGSNRQTLDISGLPDGIYFLVTADGASTNVQRVFVCGNP